MKKFRFLVDCDGVIADFATPVLNFIERDTGKKFVLEQITQWDIFASLNIPDRWDFFLKEIEKGGICSNLSTYPGSHEGIAELQSRGEVFIVTAPPQVKCWDYERREWLYKNFGIEKTHVVQTDAKHIIDGDVFIDDKPENCIKWAQAHPEKLTLLWDMPYNRELIIRKTPGAIIYRVRGWVDALERIDDFLYEIT